MSLTVLTVTQYGAHALRFLDEAEHLAERLGAEYVEHDGRAADALEYVLDEAVGRCADGYILRLDDDETVPPDLEAWLSAGEHLAATHWSFPRLNLYPDENAYITSHGLHPDLQTRLSLKAMSGGRRRVHQGSPYGAGAVCPHPLEHHKFLVRPLAERRALVEHYERLQPGAGERFRAFSVPEDVNDLALVARPAGVTA